MTQSFIVYGFIIISLMILGASAARKETVFYGSKIQNFLSIEMVLSLLIFAFFSGVRYDVGVDYLGYLDNYKHISFDGRSSLNIESGFLWITKLFAENEFHFSFYFGFIALLQILFIYLAFRDEKYLYPTLIFIIITNGTYFTWMNGIRQSIVFCIFVFMVTLIKERRYILYFLLMFVGYYIHKSAILLIPISLLIFTKRDFFKNIWLQILLLILAVYFSSTNVWNYFMEYLDRAISLFGYDESYGNIQKTMFVWEQDYRKGLRFYLPIIMYLIIAVLNKKIKEFNNNTDIIRFYNLYFPGAIFSILFYQNVLLKRPVMFLIYINCIISAFLLHYLYKSIRTNKLYLPVFIITVILHLSIFYAYIASNFHTQYKFFWEY